MSEVLILGFPDSEGSVVLLTPDIKVPVGWRMFSRFFFSGLSVRQAFEFVGGELHQLFFCHEFFHLFCCAPQF